MGTVLGKILLIVAGIGTGLGVSAEPGAQAYRNGDYVEAEEFYAGRLNQSPDEQAYLDLAALYKETGQYHKAIEILDEYLRKYSGDSLNNYPRQTLMILGELYYLAGDTDQALVLFNNLVAYQPTDWKIFFYLGLIHQGLGDLNIAQDYYQRAFKLDPNAAVAYRLAKLFYSQKHFSDAKRYFLETIRLDSSIRPAYYFLSCCLVHLKEYEEAYRYIPRAMNFYPENQQLKKQLYFVKKKLGNAFFMRRQTAEDLRRKKVDLVCYTPLAEDIPTVRVKIAQGNSITFKCGGPFQAEGGQQTFSGSAGTLYTLRSVAHNRVSIEDEDRVIQGEIPVPVVIRSGACPFYLLNITHGKGGFSQKTIDTAYRGDLEILRAGGDEVEIINVLSMEEYLYGVISAEILSSAHSEALKAQAVAARTYAFSNLKRHNAQGYDFCSSTHCQAYRGVSAETARTTAAVDATRGEVLFFEGKPISAFFHSNCGGCMRGDIFGQQPYFRRNILDKTLTPFTEDPWWTEQWFKSGRKDMCGFDEGSHCRWERVYDAEDFALEFGFEISQLKNITIREKGDCGHLKTIELDTRDFFKTITGDLPIRDFFGHLKSSAFLFEIRHEFVNEQAVPRMLFIWGAGFGHGVGMSQIGVMNMAKEGFLYPEILERYYREVHIEKIY
ncbi:MAG: SpoIID/LytB domain-containing protein [Candidatus Omnitrophica bacterium]|nr:SpoIID/LytB domain-containing protein [Candidatus Omnitrophota bacterium]